MIHQRPLVAAATVVLLCCVASAQHQYGGRGVGGGFPGGVGGGRGGGSSVVRIPIAASGVIPDYAVNPYRPVSPNVIRIPKVAMHTLPSTGGGQFGGGQFGGGQFGGGRVGGTYG
ncbi:ctenidin-1-like [Penaeus vannamei]|uniref:ctenidin-1-like n=1 Tax=Penaeus vannamei TaxID=6689 RepID=UPI00387F467B